MWNQKNARSVWVVHLLFGLYTRFKIIVMTIESTTRCLQSHGPQREQFAETSIVPCLDPGTCQRPSGLVVQGGRGWIEWVMQSITLRTCAIGGYD